MGANTSSQQFVGSSSTISDSKSSVSFDSTVVNTCSTSSSANNHHSNGGLFLQSSNESSINSIGLIFQSKDRKLKKLKQKIKTKLKKGSNHSQLFQDFANTLSTNELAQIYEEFRIGFFMKELSLHAESARPIASTIRNDLSELYDLKHNSDITLVYKGVDFPVHKAIVCVRCPYFRELLGKKEQGSVVPVNLDIKGLRVELFNDLLKYLYSGELAGSYDPRSNSASYEALIRISQQCGVPNPLSHDLKHLLETGIYSDASLCFQSASNLDSTKPSCNCCEQTEFSCHQAILSARSPFFRNVILRQKKRSATLQKNIFSQRMKITLDESIIPRRLARILLHVMYRDSENLLNLLQSSMCKCRASTSNQKDNQNSIVKEVMDLYEIARFLEIDFLVQSCEDMIISFMNLDTLILILKWSEQPHGSPWVKRQALTFLKEEFSTIISSSSLLYTLDYSHLRDALKSDFLEASELDILKSLVKWAEFQMTKQVEEKEPNLLSSHSLSRKTNKKKDIDDAKLREYLEELIEMVRIGHILPIDSEFLLNSAKRGLIELSPFMLERDSNRCYLAWLRNNGSNAHFIKPRFFSVYFEECKAILEERLERQISLDDNVENFIIIKNKQKCSTNLISIPDNLYMIDPKIQMAESLISDSDIVPNLNTFPNFHLCFTSSASSSSAICYEEIDKFHRPQNLPVLEEKIQFMMRQREQELRTSPFCVRALQISHSRCEALKLIQLRVVREFGLPDIACEVLHLKQGTSSTLPQHKSSKKHHHNVPHHKNIHQHEDEDMGTDDMMVDDDDVDDNKNVVDHVVCDRNLMPPPPPRPINSNFSHNHHHIQHHHHHPPPPPSSTTTTSNCDPFSYDSELKLEDVSQYELETQFSSTESHQTTSHLSDYIPDIAFMAKEV